MRSRLCAIRVIAYRQKSDTTIRKSNLAHTTIALVRARTAERTEGQCSVSPVAVTRARAAIRAASSARTLRIMNRPQPSHANGFRFCRLGRFFIRLFCAAAALGLYDRYLDIGEFSVSFCYRSIRKPRKRSTLGRSNLGWQTAQIGPSLDAR
jgi:hypothetical protein